MRWEEDSLFCDPLFFMPSFSLVPTLRRMAVIVTGVLGVREEINGE